MRRALGLKKADRAVEGLRKKMEKVAPEYTSHDREKRYLGLENLGNTCYCNSVLQALYFCAPFREKLLDHANLNESVGEADRNLLACLSELFTRITIEMTNSTARSSTNNTTGVLKPKTFVDWVTKESKLFSTYMHHDAHEFLNFLLNGLVDILEKDMKTSSEPSSSHQVQIDKLENDITNGDQHQRLATWVHDIFQGTLTNEITCPTCKTVTNSEETFLGLSLNIQQNSSISSCLRNFSKTETLGDEEKLFCDKCCSLQEVDKNTKIKSPPHVLSLHLKRCVQELGRETKLQYRVRFPTELKLCNTTDDCLDSEVEYSLFAVVVHVGVQPYWGHYISLVKSHNQWLSFDDETVQFIDELSLRSNFGSTKDSIYHTDEDGYLFFYERLEPKL